MTPRNILFLCPSNAVRSIMAEAYLAAAGRNVTRAFSAGRWPAATVDPQALQILSDAGIRARDLAPKSLETFALARSPRMDMIVALCDRRELGAMPFWPGSPAILDWRLAVPDTIAVSEASRKSALVDLFGEIRARVDSLLLDLPGITPVRYPAVA